MFDKEKYVAENTKNNNGSCDNEGDNYNYPSFKLTSEQLTQAIIYSEILGKPKCKTRRRR